MTGGAQDDALGISVCICTRNRAASLAVTLAALERCARPNGAWELLIVDNGSTDDTASVVRSFADRLPVRLLHEPLPGASNARNIAVREARGTYLVWTDDDTVPAPDWLVAYERAFAAFPDAVLFGGRILPVLQPPVTGWFEAACPLLDLPLARRDFSDLPVALDAQAGRIPYGANFAIRAAVQRLYRFDPALGPGAPYFGEETTLFETMLRAGHTGVWVPDSRVSHMIPPARQTERYIAWWFCMLGKSLTRKGAALEGRRLFGAPRWLWRKRVETELAYRWARATQPPSVWVARLIAASLSRGALEYCRAASRP